MRKRLTVFLSLTVLIIIMAFPSGVYASDDMKVTSFNFSEGSNGKYQLSWSIMNCPGSVSVSAYLSADMENQEGTELGSIRSGTSGSLGVEIPKVESGYYHFMIKVTPMSGNAVYAYSDEAIFYDNETSPDILSGVTSGRDDDTVYAVWDTDTSAVILIYDADTKALLEKTDAQSKPATADVPKGYSNIIIGVAAYENGSSGRFTPVQNNKNDNPSTTDIFESTDMVSVASYTVKVPSDAAGFRLYNGEKECTGSDGIYKIELLEGENQLVAFISDNLGNTAALAKSVTLDSTPPELVLENIGTTLKTTNRDLCINGYSEEDATVTCDKEAVTLVGRCFSIDKKLSYGNQTIRIEATDKAGNISVREINVNCSFWSYEHIGLIFVLVLGGVGAVFELYMLFIRQRRARRKNEQKNN